MRSSGRLRKWSRLLWTVLLGRSDQMDRGLGSGRSWLLFFAVVVGLYV